MTRIGACWMLVAVLLGSGCKQYDLTLQPGPRVFTPDSYPLVWEAWTRGEESFSWKDLAHELHVTATFESWEFRWAYVVRYARDYSLLPSARDEMLQASLASSRQEHRFFVSLVGFDFRESNLVSKQSAWRVLLVDPSSNQSGFERGKVRFDPASQALNVGRFVSEGRFVSGRFVSRFAFCGRGRPTTRRVRL